MKKFTFFTLALTLLCSLNAGAQLKIKGVYQQGRDNDGELGGTYLGWNSTLGKSISVVPQGIYLMEWDGNTPFDGINIVIKNGKAIGKVVK